MIPLTPKKLTFEMKKQIPPGGGIVFTATLSDITPKSKRGKQLAKDRDDLLIVVDLDKPAKEKD